VVAGLDLAGLPVAGAATPELDAAQPADPALLLYTSGTTGTPKGALLSHGNLLSSARAVALAWRWTPDDRLLLTLPLFHMHGLGVGVNGSLLAGGQLVLRPGFDAADVAERCRGGAVSMFFGVPAMYQRLLAGGEAAALSGLRLIVSGSAPLSESQSDAVAAAAGQRPLERYGMTETVMLTSNPIDGLRKPGHVGLPLPGVNLRLAAGNEVEVSGPNVLAGYDRGGSDPAAAEAADAEAFTADGWFRTGDLGEMDADGYLRLVGRSKELIITGGFNVHPREVEEAISRFPGVREAAVVGRPSERWGEAVTAVVVADRPLDPVELREFAAQRLASYKVPKTFEFVQELPRNALGKILRHQL
jgi:malonyl-CoA/methylmalonyl-CoA synthetase